MSDTYTVPSSPTATSLRNCAPSILSFDETAPLAMSMPTTSSMSAVHSVPSWLRSPFGALRPVTHDAETTVPSGASFMIRPLPSRPPASPSMIETKIDPDAASTYTLSGVATPSVTVQPAVTRPGAAAGVALAAGGGADWFSGAELHPEKAMPSVPRTSARLNRFTCGPPSERVIEYQRFQESRSHAVQTSDAPRAAGACRRAPRVRGREDDPRPPSEHVERGRLPRLPRRMGQ